MLKNAGTLLAISLMTLISSCGIKNETENKMNRIAESYVKLVLEIGLYNSDFVDAYYGPDEWRPEESTKEDSFPYSKLSTEAARLKEELNKVDTGSLQAIELKRHASLLKQMRSVNTGIEMINGKNYKFDEESKLLYDATAPVIKEEYFIKILDKLDSLLPGEGEIQKRVEKFRKDFIVPEDKLEAVFSAAIEECRKRTLKYIDLPAHESFVVEYVNDKPWGAYNWYKGNAFSVIQFNTDFPTQISRAVDIAAHEGYPGHHVFNLLLEENLAKKNGWVEYSVYPLFSMQSLIAEGTANYGKEIVLPKRERIKFEKEVLFPLAGIDPDKADKYYEVITLLDNLSYAGNESSRNYLDGIFNKNKTLKWISKYTLRSPQRAEQSIEFTEKYRSYVINYNLGEDIIKNYIESNGGTADNPSKQWELFEELLSTPQTPSGLIERTR